MDECWKVQQGNFDSKIGVAATNRCTLYLSMENVKWCSSECSWDLMHYEEHWSTTFSTQKEEKETISVVDPSSGKTVSSIEISLCSTHVRRGKLRRGLAVTTSTVSCHGKVTHVESLVNYSTQN